MIIAPYFTQSNNFSQHDSSGKCKPDDFKLISNWYNSVLKSGVDRALIFHDECSIEFTEKYTNNIIGFYCWDSHIRKSYNDDRFFAYLDFVKKHPEINKIIFTDLFDVQLLRNPFELICDNNYDLYSGSEILTNGSSQWMTKKSKKANLPLPRNNYAPGNLLYNAGIIGGFRDVIINLFEEMTNMISNLSNDLNINMPIYNLAIEKLNLKVYTGHPFHNIFRSNSDQGGCYIIHK